MSKHALITINVTKFVNVLAAASQRRSIKSKAAYSFTPHPDGGVKMLGPNGDLAVWIPLREIRFVFSDPRYRPTGISFRQTGSDESDRYGIRNMTERVHGQERNKPAHVKFMAVRRNSGRNWDTYKWKFSISYEDIQTGLPGMIDPEIGNTDLENFTKKRKRRRLKRRR